MGVALHKCSLSPQPLLILVLSNKLCTQFSSVQSLDQLGHHGDMRNDSAEILFQSFLQKALVSSSGMGRDVKKVKVKVDFAHNLV